MEQPETHKRDNRNEAGYESESEHCLASEKGKQSQRTNAHYICKENINEFRGD